MNLPILLPFIAFSLIACASTREEVVITDDELIQADEKVYETVDVLKGKASYYYGRWIGRLTANGETYRASDVTAAHKTLPFNTMVRVTNLRNDKSVIVRINNRGPYIKGRILDLSLEAAKAIEMTKAGVVPVRAEVLQEIEAVEEPNAEVEPDTILAALARLTQAAEESEEAEE